MGVMRATEPLVRESRDEHGDFYRIVVECANSIVLKWNTNGIITYLNPYGLKFFNYKESEAIGKHMVGTIIPERDVSEKDMGRMVDDILRNPEQYKNNLNQNIRSDGKPVWVSWTNVALPLQEGRSHEILSIGNDATELIEAQEELRESEKRLKLILERMQAGIVIIDPETRKILDINQMACTVFGTSREEIIGSRCHKFMVQAEEGRCPIIDQGQTLYNSELTLVNAKGKTVPILKTVTKINIYGKERLIESFVDITARKHAEDELKQAHAQLKQLLSAITAILIALDSDDRITEWNGPAQEAFGMSREEVIGRKINECNIGWDGTKVDAAIMCCKETGKPVRLDSLPYRAGDSERLLGLTVNSICAEGEGKLLCGIMIRGADITERQAMESQLAQAQKLESIGQLAAGIAHEINTPTQYVGDNTRFLKEGFEDLDRLVGEYQELGRLCREGCGIEEFLKGVEETAEEIDLEYLREEIPSAIAQSLEGVERVAKIVGAMKEFSHPGSDEKTPTDINRAIENTVTVARNEWKYVADLETDFDENLPPVPCLPGELNQVILNMIVNGSHAIADVVGDTSGEKGTITIRTHKDGEWIRIRIEDTGAGIPEEIRQRIFDPFFTTKEVGKGTGQGLSIAHNVIVDKHGGTIDVESEVGKGTAFTIRLPLEG